ncbi:MAG TPA: GDP-mannose 4,6-dehydratase [Candidatus Eisenbacteria bacterium]|nr:GDP-mannose 4,6-dehydratase [Candidatus Eisenbacteria bacterium]
MKALVTGGAGFIGSYLTEALLESGHAVSVIDDLSTGRLGNLRRSRSFPGFRFTRGSIEDRKTLGRLVDRCDVVYHLAAVVGVKLVIEKPVRTLRANLRGTETVLELAGRRKKPVLIASTSEVYGKSLKAKFAETDDLLIGPPTVGRWSYACSKATDEFLALSYWKEKKQPVVIARIFNTVGPRQTGRYGMVVPTLVRQAVRGETITVFGDGRQKRCFNHVEDTVSALVSLMEDPACRGQIFNVGNDREISILDLAKLVKKMTRSRSRIKIIPYHEAYEEGFEDMLRRVPDLAKLRRRTGYRPRRTLEEILRDVIDFESRARRTPRTTLS